MGEGESIGWGGGNLVVLTANKWEGRFPGAFKHFSKYSALGEISQFFINM
jgi:hypothetical protein